MDTLHSLETPAVVIDLDKLRRNLARAQSAADAAGLALRPHIKTHKSLRLAQEQIARGAVGVTCQKLAEAEVMADGGIDDILLTYNILGAAKLARLRALADRDLRQPPRRRRLPAGDGGCGQAAERSGGMRYRHGALRRSDRRGRAGSGARS